jgi:Phage P22-like portal protein
MAKTDKTIVERAKDFFKRVVEAESDQREEELDDIRFANLDQWPSLIKNIRENDPQGARPCLVVDKVGQYKNQIVNSMRENRPSIKVRPVDDIADKEVADVYEGLVRHIQDTSKADIAYDWAGECAATSGLGYFRILTEYVDDTFQQQIRIARIRNRFSVYFDPNSKEPDGSDAKECIITDVMPKEAFEQMYPECDTSSWDVATGDNGWHDKDTVRIAEYFYIEKKKEELYLLEDGNSIFASEYAEKYLKETESAQEDNQEPAGYDVGDEGQGEMPNQEDVQPLQAPQVIAARAANKITVKWCKIAGGEDKPLKETTFPGIYIPVIPVIGIESDLDGKRYLRGIIRGVKDAQRVYNYQRSVMTESLGLTVKAPFIGATGQFKTSGDKWAASNNVNFPYLEYDPVTTQGQLAPPPQRQGYAGVPAGLLQDMETSEHDIQASLGMYQASIGQDGNAKSGIAMNAQQKAGDLATFQFPDNLAKSVRHCGRILIDIIPLVMEKAQMVRILGEDGSHDYANIDPEQPQAKVEKRGQDGAIKKIFNLGVGKYDVTSTVGSSFATKRMEGANFMTQIAQSNPDLVTIIGDIMFKAMDMPYSDDVAKRLKIMLPPPIQQALQADEQGENPEVQQVKQQAQQIIDQLTQQLQSAHAAMQEADQEHQQATSGQGAEEAKINADGMKAQAEAAKASESEKTRRYETMLKVASDIVTKAMSLPIENQEDAAMMATEQIAPVTENPDMLKEMVAALLQTSQETQMAMMQSMNAPRKIDLQYDQNGMVTGGISQNLNEVE